MLLKFNNILTKIFTNAIGNIPMAFFCTHFSERSPSHEFNRKRQILRLG